MMEVMSGPYRLSTDSPSKQLLRELGRIANSAQQDLYARLDKEYSEREAVHRHQLTVAAAEHERIRRNAEVARERLQLQVEVKRRQQEEEERNELERKREEDVAQKLAAQRRETQRLNNLHAEEDRLHHTRKAQAETTAALQQKQKAAKERQDVANTQAVRDKAAADAKLQEAEVNSRAVEASLRSQSEQQQEQEQQLQQQSRQLQQAPSTSKSQKLDSSLLIEHNRYLEIHKRLKDLRKYMVIQANQNPVLKKQMGDGRRAIRKCVGQLTGDAKAREKPLAELMTILDGAAKTAEPPVDIFMFLTALPPQDTITDNTGPALLLYQLSIFSKAIISQWVTEAGATPKAAEPIGIVASTIFSQPRYQWNKYPLIDILLAKMHVVCPVLFGIHGNDKTEQGREKLGWLRESPKGPFIQEQRHNERMTGLGAGFAAISLRNYAKSSRTNAYPSHNYWRTFAYIVNTPSEHVTSTHFVILKAMIENYEQKILTAFGDMAIPALRKALFEYPASVKEPGVAGKSLALLADVLRRDRKLGL